MTTPAVLYPGMQHEYCVDPDGGCWAIPAPSAPPGSVQRSERAASTPLVGHVERGGGQGGDTAPPASAAGSAAAAGNWLG